MGRWRCLAGRDTSHELFQQWYFFGQVPAAGAERAPARSQITAQLGKRPAQLFQYLFSYLSLLLQIVLSQFFDFLHCKNGVFQCDNHIFQVLQIRTGKRNTVFNSIF